MGASIDDIGITIVSNGEEAYYSSYKGVNNILWEKNFGLYSDKKPNASTIFNFSKDTLWNDSIHSLKKPLKKPVYGVLTVNFDNKTIVDDNGYGSWNIMYLDWFVNCIFRFSRRDMQGWNEQTGITEQTVIEHLKNGNFYIGNRLRKAVDLILPDNIHDTYDLFVSLGYDDYTNRPISVINKDYSWAQIKLPQHWTVTS